MKIIPKTLRLLLATILITGAGNIAQAEIFQGSGGQDVFSGSLTGEDDFFGYGEYDQINYDGASSDYDFQSQANGQINNYKPDGGYDILDSIEGIWFQGEQAWYSTDDLVNGGGGGSSATVYQGTAGQDVFTGTLAGATEFYGYASYDQVNYEGSSSDYTFESQANGQVFVQKPDGSTDILDSIEGFWFQGEGAWYPIEDLINSGGGGGGQGQLTHFGQNITLNGANVAWIDFGADVGNGSSNAAALQSKFAEIASAGGNSARVWIHASGWLTPNVDQNGYVSGISSNNAASNQTNAQVVDILDAAWDEGIVVNLVLFSFEMMCNNNGGDKGARFDQMINNNYQSYLDNVLDPLVRATKDHEALFSYEIFNEADGMTQGTDFFNDNCAGVATYPQSEYVLQRFVNLASAEIKSIDRNVKVTSSVSQTARLGQYTNDVLTGQNFSDPTGTLDYYQAHWYWAFGHGDNPYINNADDRGLDRPIVIGEFGYGTEPQTGTQNQNLAKNLLDLGYAGAWIWDQTGLPQWQVDTVISGASSYSPSINKTAVENCIQSQASNCYNQ